MTEEDLRRLIRCPEHGVPPQHPKPSYPVSCWQCHWAWNDLWHECFRHPGVIWRDCIPCARRRQAESDLEVLEEAVSHLGYAIAAIGKSLPEAELRQVLRADDIIERARNRVKAEVERVKAP